MGIRKCIIADCPSTSARPEDVGVTYHKIPAKAEAKQKWLEVCRIPENFGLNTGSNVCSRHFRKIDFQEFKGKKYVLKTGAVPSIFSWTVAALFAKQNDVDKGAESNASEEVKQNEYEKSPNEPEETPKDSVKPVIKSEPVDEIAEKSVKEEDAAKTIDQVEIKHEVADDDIVLKDDVPISPMTTPKRSGKGKRRGSTRRASSRGSTAKKSRRSEPTTPKETRKSLPSPKKCTPTSTVTNTGTISQPQINFTAGTKIEAQDFSGVWHLAKLIEVDSEEGEVLIEFDKSDKSKSVPNDEWIPMDSVRLRPLQTLKSPSSKTGKFAVGEKCYARWSDSRKFRATIRAILDNDSYEVLFDDGFVKTCKSSHVTKLKKADKMDSPEMEILSPPIKQEPDAIAAVSTPPTPAAPVTPVLPVSSNYIPQVAKLSDFPEIPRDGQWCCHWMNDFPVGEESSLILSGIKNHTVIVYDWRLPEGWVKHIYQRYSAYGKMDVVLVDPEGKIFRSRQELKMYMALKGEELDPNIYDFGLHKRRAKELGFFRFTNEYKTSLPNAIKTEPTLVNTEVNIGSVKVKIIGNLFQCPEPDCLKTFRKENHLQIHIKHYHKELAKGLGEIPNMQDLAALRTPVEIVETPPKTSRRKSLAASASKTLIKEEPKTEVTVKIEPEAEEEERKADQNMESEPVEPEAKKAKQDTDDVASPVVASSEMAENVQSPIPDVATPAPISAPATPVEGLDLEDSIKSHSVSKPAKKTTKIKLFTRRRRGKKTKFITRKVPAPTSTTPAPTGPKKRRKKLSSTRNSMDYMDADETRHSFAASGGNDSFFRHSYGYEKDADASQTTNASICGQYGDDSINAAVSSPRFINENGELIKIVSMRKEEIINCLCGYGEEDGLMVQCELCLCWQHGICNGFERDNQVPDKYICMICRNPQGGRESRRYMHDQDWLYEGKLPVASYHVPNSKHAARFDILKQSHTLAGNLLELKRFLHSLKVKINIAEKKDHPKMYLWSKKWEKSPHRGGNGDVAGIVPLNHSSSSAATTVGQGAVLGKGDGSVQKSTPIPHIPIPEAPIDPAECQAILLEHIQKQQNAAMARLQAIEAQIIALEAYDDKSELLESPTAKNYPKTKQTIHMLLNDLVKMKKIAAIHRSAQKPLTF